jgi:hypothetical protein
VRDMEGKHDAPRAVDGKREGKRLPERPGHR